MGWGQPGTRGCVEASPPSGGCHLRARRLWNWTGGARVWAGKAAGGVRLVAGRRSGAGREAGCGGGCAGWDGPGRGGPQLGARRLLPAQSPHYSLHQLSPARTEPTCTPARGARALRGVRARRCRCASAALAGRVRAAQGGLLSRPRLPPSLPAAELLRPTPMRLQLYL